MKIFVEEMLVKKCMLNHNHINHNHNCTLTISEYKMQNLNEKGSINISHSKLPWIGKLSLCILNG